MKKKTDRVRNGSIIQAEGEYHLLCLATIDGMAANEGMLVSVPDADDPEQRLKVRHVDVPTLEFAIKTGGVELIAEGAIAPSREEPSRGSIGQLMLEGHIFSAGRRARALPSLASPPAIEPSPGFKRPTAAAGGQACVTPDASWPEGTALIDVRASKRRLATPDRRFAGGWRKRQRQGS